jgi:hypothetical protein
MTNGVQKREPLMLPANLRKLTALHEAGHAVAARAYRLPIDFAEIGADPEGGPRIGRVVHRKCDDAWASTVIALAGPIAETFISGQDGKEGADNDFETADRNARRFDPQQSTKVVREARTAALTLVRVNCIVISRLAIVLERKGKLSGAEIDDIIGEVGPGPDPMPGARFRSARMDAARRRARGDHEGADFIEKWIRQQESPR